MKKESILIKIVLHTLAIAGAFICLFPFYWMIKTSLVDLGNIFEIPPKLISTNFQIDNYKTALSQYPFGRFYLNSTIITVLTIIGTLLTSSMCAYSFSRLNWKGRDKVFAFILTGLMLPFFVVMIPHFIMWKTVGLTNTFAPLIVPAWFGGGVFNIFLLRQFFLGIPKDMDEAARIDGASYLRIYAQIIVPMSKQAMIVVGLLTFLNSWNDYLGPVIYITKQNRYTLMQGLSLFMGGYAAQWNYMMAATCIVVIPSLIIFLIAQKHFIEGIAMTGVKG